MNTMTVTEAAKAHEVSTGTIRRWCRTGKLNAHKDTAGRWVITTEPTHEETTMTEQHHTVWVATEANVLMGDVCDVTIIEDEIHGYDTDIDGNETPFWTSGSNVKLTADTTVRHDADDASEAFEQAAEILQKAGWEITGEWDHDDTGAHATCERI